MNDIEKEIIKILMKTKTTNKHKGIADVHYYMRWTDTEGSIKKPLSKLYSLDEIEKAIDRLFAENFIGLEKNKRIISISKRGIIYYEDEINGEHKIGFRPQNQGKQ